jgi:hypothetical protein
LINEEIMAMYINREEAKQEPFIGEKVSLIGSATPICGGSCDYPMRFDSKRGAVYVPNNSILMRLGNYYKVKVEPSKSVENASEFGFHKNELSVFRLKDGRLEKEFSPEILIGRKFAFAGLSADL